VLISTLKIVVPIQQRVELLEILRSVVGPTETQPGCLSCRIYQDYGSDQTTMLCEHWKSFAALKEHIRSEIYLRVLAACELSSQPPEFCFHHVSDTQGMGLIHELRGDGRDILPPLKKSKN
jgi:quinol monooxygenase YgiN